MLRRSPRPFRVALVVPLQGSAGIYGPSCVLCARLAAEEIDGEGGVLDRPIRLHIVDGATGPQRVTAEVDRLVTSGAVDAVVGWHLSAVRQRLAPRLAGRVPYVFTALYEGGETTPGVFTTGETPGIQLSPALQWMATEIGVHRWMVVGNDYVWPLRTTEVVRAMAGDGVQIDGAAFVGLGARDFGPALQRIEDGPFDGVLMLLVGQDSVEFSRQFAARGLEERCARLSPLMDETMLGVLGPAAAHDVFTAAGFFESLATPESLEFGARYVRRFGPGAPVLNAPGESCYEGVRLLASLVNRAGSTTVEALDRAAAQATWDGPRGTVRLTGSYAEQRIYIAAADGTGYDILDSL